MFYKIDKGTKKETSFWCWYIYVYTILKFMYLCVQISGITKFAFKFFRWKTLQLKRNNKNYQESSNYLILKYFWYLINKEQHFYQKTMILKNLIKIWVVNILVYICKRTRD